MAATFNIANVFAESQKRMYQASLERNQLILRLALAERMQKEMEKVEQKYDGSAGNALQRQIEEMSVQKEFLAGKLSNVKDALDRFLDIKIKVQEARSSAVDDNSPAGWDSLLSQIESLVGSRATNPKSIIGSPGNGAWAQKNDVVSVNGLQTTVKNHYLGNDYRITLSDGKVLVPDMLNKTLSGSGLSMSMADLSLTSRDADGNVTFTDTSTGTSYTGVLTQGGTGMLNSWLYSDFSNDAGDAAADAIRAMDNAQRSLQQNEAVLEAMVNSYSLKMKDMTEEWGKVTDEEMAAKSAERKAIQLRMSLTESNFAVSSNAGAYLIHGLFSKPPSFGKQSALEILYGSMTQR